MKNESVAWCKKVRIAPRPGGGVGRGRLGRPHVAGWPPAGSPGARPGSGGRGGARRPPTQVPRKEVIQPHLPVRLPCYDFTPVTRFALDTGLRKGWPSGFKPPALPWCDGRCVQGPGTYSPRCADPRLLATPPSWGRVAAPNLN